MTTTQRIIKYCALGLAALLVVSIIGSLIAVISAISWFMDREEAVMAGDVKIYHVEHTVTELDLEVGAAALRIEVGSQFRVESNLKHLTVQESGGKLLIRQKKHFGNGSYKGVMVTVTIPAEHRFDTATITTGAGQVYIEALNTNRLEMELGAGEVKINSLLVQHRADIETGVGQVAISSGYLQDLELEMGVGKLILSAYLAGKCTIEQGIGEANLELRGEKESYTLSVTKGLGDIRIDGETVKNDCTYGDGTQKVTIKGGIGAIYIQFKSE